MNIYQETFSTGTTTQPSAVEKASGKKDRRAAEMETAGAAPGAQRERGKKKKKERWGP